MTGRPLAPDGGSGQRGEAVGRERTAGPGGSPQDIAIPAFPLMRLLHGPDSPKPNALALRTTLF